MYSLTDVVKKLMIVNVAVYIIAMAFSQYVPTLAMFHPLSDNFAPYGIITHMFMHSTAGPSHLFMNMLLLFFFGPHVERALGAKKFLILYFVAGFAAMATHFLISSNPIVGASGALYGVLFAFIMMYPDIKVMLLIPPIPLKAKYMALIYVAFDLFGAIQGTSNVAHFAHLGGAAAGIILILLWKKSNFKL